MLHAFIKYYMYKNLYVNQTYTLCMLCKHRSPRKFRSIRKFPTFSGNSGISGKSGNFGKCRGNFSGFRGKLFFRISEIVKTSGTFLSNFMFFIKTDLPSSVHSIKIHVKLIKIRVFSEKNPPKMSRDVSGKSPEIPRKTSAFFFRFFSVRRKDTA
jgi:hypothetical protein